MQGRSKLLYFSNIYDQFHIQVVEWMMDQWNVCVCVCVCVSS